MPTLQVNGTDLHYEERGSGMPALFSHAVGADADSWAPLIDRLEHVFRCITYERRGYPRSPRPDGEISSVQVGADDVAAIVDALGLAPCLLVGTSWGGLIALDALRRHGNRFLGGVLAEPTVAALDPMGGAQLFARILPVVGAALARGDFGAAVDGLHSELSPDFWAQLDEDSREKYRATGRGLAYDFTMTAYEFMPLELRTVVQPCQVILGSRSNVFFQHIGKALAKHLPSAEIVAVEGAGHAVCTEAPDRCAEAILRFRNRLLH